MGELKDKPTDASCTLSNELAEKLVLVAESYGTPLYVYVEDIIESQVRKVFDVFEGVNLVPTFACKANNNPVLISKLYSLGFGADVVTVGEYHAAKLGGVQRELIVWNGNGKSKADIAFLADKVGYVNVDSLEELRRWDEVDTGASLFLRINPDVDPRTHPHISTGLKLTKFGIHLEFLEKAFNMTRKKFDGFHVHIGSQITSIEPFESAVRVLVELSEKYGLRCVNIGGGWGIDYAGEELDVKAFKRTVVPLLGRFDKVLIELGRFIIGPAGFLVLKVEYVKKTPYKTFIVTDGGMNVLIRPSMYGAYHRVHVLTGSGEVSDVDIVGPLCETGDVLATSRNLEIPLEGTYLVVENTGAYGFSMASNYNSTLLPAEVLINLKTGTHRLIRRRQTYEQLFENVVLD